VSRLAMSAMDNNQQEENEDHHVEDYVAHLEGRALELEQQITNTETLMTRIDVCLRSFHQLAGITALIEELARCRCFYPEAPPPPPRNSLSLWGISTVTDRVLSIDEHLRWSQERRRGRRRSRQGGGDQQESLVTPPADDDELLLLVEIALESGERGDGMNQHIMSAAQAAVREFRMTQQRERGDWEIASRRTNSAPPPPAAAAVAAAAAPEEEIVSRRTNSAPPPPPAVAVAAAEATEEEIVSRRTNNEVVVLMDDDSDEDDGIERRRRRRRRRQRCPQSHKVMISDDGIDTGEDSDWMDEEDDKKPAARPTQSTAGSRPGSSNDS